MIGFNEVNDPSTRVSVAETAINSKNPICKPPDEFLSKTEWMIVAGITIKVDWFICFFILDLRDHIVGGQDVIWLVYDLTPLQPSNPLH